MVCNFSSKLDLKEHCILLRNVFAFRTCLYHFLHSVGLLIPHANKFVGKTATFKQVLLTMLAAPCAQIVSKCKVWTIFIYYKYAHSRDKIQRNVKVCVYCIKVYNEIEILRINNKFAPPMVGYGNNYIMPPNNVMSK